MNLTATLYQTRLPVFSHFCYCFPCRMWKKLVTALTEHRHYIHLALVHDFLLKRIIFFHLCSWLLIDLYITKNTFSVGMYFQQKIDFFEFSKAIIKHGQPCLHMWPQLRRKKSNNFPSWKILCLIKTARFGMCRMYLTNHIFSSSTTSTPKVILVLMFWDICIRNDIKLEIHSFAMNRGSCTFHAKAKWRYGIWKFR